MRPLRVGVVSAANSRTTTFWAAFLERMKDHGYIEGHNFALDFTNLGGHLDRYPDETAKLVERGVDIIIASGVELGLKSAVGVTKTVPIIMIAADYDPLALGYVSNLARPGGNITGLMFQQLEQTEKRIQLLRDAIPDLKSATVLWDRISADQWRVAQQVAPTSHITRSSVESKSGGSLVIQFDRGGNNHYEMSLTIVHRKGQFWVAGFTNGGATVCPGTPSTKTVPALERPDGEPPRRLGLWALRGQPMRATSGLPKRPFRQSRALSPSSHRQSMFQPESIDAIVILASSTKRHHGRALFSRRPFRQRQGSSCKYVRDVRCRTSCERLFDHLVGGR